MAAPSKVSCLLGVEQEGRDENVLDSFNEMSLMTDWVAVIKPILAIPTGPFVRSELLDVCKAILGR